MSDTLTTDVVIVGSGVAGALVADALTRAGVGVIMLEAGPPVDRDQAVEVFRAAPAKVPESPYPNVPWAPHPTSLEIGVPGTGYFIQDGPDAFGSTYERIVGGTTWHWLGSTPRLLPRDFEMRTRFGVGADWPITYGDLEPWYVRAEHEMGVSGDSNEDLGSPRSAGYPMEAIPTSFLDGVIGRAAAGIGLQVRSTPQARNSESSFNDRPRCEGNSNCIPICPIGAKYDALIHLERAQENGARLVANAVVFDVLVSDGRATGVRFRTPDRTDHTVLAKAVVLAAHGIETPKILLSSDNGRGVANSSDQVGRNLMDHPIQLSWALSRDPVYPQRGPGSTAGIDSTRERPDAGARSAFRVEIGNDGWRFPIGDPTFEFTSPGPFPRLREGGNELARRWNDHVQREIRFASSIEQLPDPGNRIVPDFDNLDDIGLPRPRISFAVGESVRAGMADAAVVHEKLFAELEATERNHSDVAFGAGHIMGTTAMGDDPATSVVDAEGRSHDVPNLWVVGSSVFPTAGTANPTLTLAALALRTAERLVARL